MSSILFLGMLAFGLIFLRADYLYSNSRKTSKWLRFAVALSASGFFICLGSGMAFAFVGL